MTDKPRAAALELLRAVREDDAYANLVLPQLLHGYGLSGRDAAFATELAYGTLRGRGWYDAVLSSCVTRPWDKVEPALQRRPAPGRPPDPGHAGARPRRRRLVVRAGARSRHAAGGGRARRLRQRRAAQGRGRTTRRAGRERLQGDRADDDVEWLATRYSHPAWIVRAVRDALGTRRDELPDLLAADNAPARPSLVARPGRMTPEELLDLPEVEPGRWSPLAGTLVDGTPDMLAVRARRPGGSAGRGQPARGARPGARRGRRRRGEWLDACAGPGGKAALLDGLAHERGGRPRRRRAARRTAPTSSRARSPPARRRWCSSGDARRAPWGDRLFDRVLVDAPCTGLGALRRRPESRWRRTTGRPRRTRARIQRDLLRAGHRRRPGPAASWPT